MGGCSPRGWWLAITHCSWRRVPSTVRGLRVGCSRPLLASQPPKHSRGGDRTWRLSYSDREGLHSAWDPRHSLRPEATVTGLQASGAPTVKQPTRGVRPPGGEAYCARRFLVQRARPAHRASWPTGLHGSSCHRARPTWGRRWTCFQLNAQHPVLPAPETRAGRSGGPGAAWVFAAADRPPQGGQTALGSRVTVIVPAEDGVLCVTQCWGRPAGDRTLRVRQAGWRCWGHREAWSLCRGFSRDECQSRESRIAQPPPANGSRRMHEDEKRGSCFWGAGDRTDEADPRGPSAQDPAGSRAKRGTDRWTFPAALGGADGFRATERP